MSARNLTYTEEVTLIRHQCGQCGVIFAMPEFLMRERREDGGTWYCPNGHGRCYRESDVARLERELASAEARATHAQDQLRAAERRAAAARKRVGNGVCPCCHRSFVQLSRHMKTKHPDYASQP